MSWTLVATLDTVMTPPGVAVVSHGRGLGEVTAVRVLTSEVGAVSWAERSRWLFKLANFLRADDALLANDASHLGMFRGPSSRSAVLICTGTPPLPMRPGQPGLITATQRADLLPN